MDSTLIVIAIATTVTMVALSVQRKRCQQRVNNYDTADNADGHPFFKTLLLIAASLVAVVILASTAWMFLQSDVWGKKIRNWKGHGRIVSARFPMDEDDESGDESDDESDDDASDDESDDVSDGGIES